MLLKDQELERLKRELYERDQQLSNLQQPAMKRQELSVNPDDVDISSIIADPTFISICNSNPFLSMQNEEFPTLENIVIQNERAIENTNQTLPLGMNLSDEVLVDLSKYKLEETNKEEFKMNYLQDEYTNRIIKVHCIEYNVK